MFTKNHISAILRLVLITILLSNAMDALLGQTVVHALGDTLGSLDTTFDGDGLVTTAIGSSDDDARAVAIQLDGKIVIAGRFSKPGYDDFFVVRYNNDGSLDTNFITDGIATINFGGDDVARAVIVEECAAKLTNLVRVEKVSSSNSSSS